MRKYFLVSIILAFGWFAWHILVFFDDVYDDVIWNLCNVIQQNSNKNTSFGFCFLRQEVVEENVLCSSYLKHSLKDVCCT